MSRYSKLLFALVIGGLGALVSPGDAIAKTPLNRATVRQLRNAVRLTPKNQSSRTARVSDRMRPGDALSTGRSSSAELGFNDGSLARLGEKVVFRFVPQTRTFKLSNGTMLMLIPPGQGRTRVRTPNATAGIRGSGLFVRYIQERDMTLIGALTTSGIEVCGREDFNNDIDQVGATQPQSNAGTDENLNSIDSGIEAFNDCQQSYELKGGQLAIVSGDRLQSVSEFDLRQFYETSKLVEGLQLDQPASLIASSDESFIVAPAVRTEIEDAIEAQIPFPEVSAAPVFQLPPALSLPQESDPAPIPGEFEPSVDSIETVFEAGEQQSSIPSIIPVGGVTTPEPQVEPPVTEPPIVVEPPVTEPPIVEEPPVGEPEKEVEIIQPEAIGGIGG